MEGGDRLEGDGGRTGRWKETVKGEGEREGGDR